MKFGQIKIIISSLFCFVMISAWSNGQYRNSPLYPITVSDQLADSDGVIIGTFQGKSYKKDHSGNVETVAHFFVEQVVGVAPNNILNRYSFRVTFPGGRWQGIYYRDSGMPQLIEGERTVLIVKKGKFGFVLPQRGLSKFSFVNEGDELFLVSNYFKEKNGVGKVSWSKFNFLVEEQFGMRVGAFTNTEKTPSRYIASARSRKNMRSRYPAASYKEEDEGYKLDSSWLVIIFGLMGGLFSLVGRYQEESDS